MRGPWATPSSDLTARIALDGLAPGREYDAALWFEDERGTPRRGPARPLLDRGLHPARDLVRVDRRHRGPGLGDQPRPRRHDGYRRCTRPGPTSSCTAGDTIYADGPIAEPVVEPDGQVWRNLVTPEVAEGRRVAWRSSAAGTATT